MTTLQIFFNTILGMIALVLGIFGITQGLFLPLYLLLLVAGSALLGIVFVAALLRR